ncbi:alpha/beta fold hydrolase [Microlunatus sp. Y2014]|uniref:alpha/beta fold hydrolase n=1 Tax=Microlunatus sp. Y2014 TaxID=3418488 RepID=UPI003DA6F161
MMELHHLSYGTSGPRIVFCHGLLGQGRNFTTVAKALADDHRCLLFDLPNHGRSPWTEHFDYAEIAEIVADQLVGDAADPEPSIVVGHSLGGKVAMRLALDHPELVSRLCVVDMSPVTYDSASDLGGYVSALLSLDLATLSDRATADALLTDEVPDPTVRGFLLQNLRQDRGRWFFQPNLELFDREMAAVTGWEPVSTTYDGPVLWVAGANSDYVTDAYEPAMRELFPTTRLVRVKNAGHWVHSEQPEVFTQILAFFARQQARTGGDPPAGG